MRISGCGLKVLKEMFGGNIPMRKQSATTCKDLQHLSKAKLLIGRAACNITQIYKIQWDFIYGGDIR